MKPVLTYSVACFFALSGSYTLACEPEQAREKAWQLAETANQLGGEQLEQIERFAQELSEIREQTPAPKWVNSCQIYDVRLAEFELAKTRLEY